jgi:DNA-binding NarL/FixJ family response regulator
MKSRSEDPNSDKTSLLTPLSKTVRAEIKTFCEGYRLTPRESEIVTVMAEGAVRIRDIADHLRLSPNTVNNHVNSIFTKTKTRSKSQLLAALLSRIADELESARCFRRLPRLFIVSQDITLVEPIVQQLGSRGFLVQVFRSQEDCERVLRDYTPHFILSDLKAGTDPREIIKRFHAFGPAQIVFVGPDARLETRCEAMHAGAIDLVARPLDVNKLSRLLLSHYIEDDVDRLRFLELEAPTPKPCRDRIEVSRSNLGIGGIFLSSEDLKRLYESSVTEGDFVELSLQTSGSSRSLQARGQVVWVRDGVDGRASGAGVRLLYSRPEDADSRQQLRSYLREHSIQSYIPNR